jgi:hypothetical protein
MFITRRVEFFSQHSEVDEWDRFILKHVNTVTLLKVFRETEDSAYRANTDCLYSLIVKQICSETRYMFFSHLEGQVIRFC